MICETCGGDATDYKLDSLTDPHYYCPAHASPPRDTWAAVCAVTFASSRPAITYLLRKEQS